MIFWNITSLKYIPSVLQLSILIHLFEMSNSVWRTQKWNVYQYKAKGINSKTKQKSTAEKVGGTNVEEIKVTYVTKKSNPALD